MLARSDGGKGIEGVCVFVCVRGYGRSSRQGYPGTTRRRGGSLARSDGIVIVPDDTLVDEKPSENDPGLELEGVSFLRGRTLCLVYKFTDPGEDGDDCRRTAVLALM
ncbi:hypothetical protein N7462_011253 [Penicillium macrosclerotiorum]|uniref:uncharacterized protein n=1 Tax=Penicillium macrosclerotiorum TaxID=303699 RepID=UPI002548F37E|nr:uncharacterized protein N7462_011253 [Penicillium macrosclerotiorum]KAJ5666844.1 hypothetical protein N7462_011253 [Penicillium macrosclerotiorum]